MVFGLGAGAPLETKVCVSEFFNEHLFDGSDGLRPSGEFVVDLVEFVAVAFGECGGEDAVFSCVESDGGLSFGRFRSAPGCVPSVRFDLFSGRQGTPPWVTGTVLCGGTSACVYESADPPWELLPFGQAHRKMLWLPKMTSRPLPRRS